MSFIQKIILLKMSFIIHSARNPKVTATQFGV